MYPNNPTQAFVDIVEPLSANQPYITALPVFGTSTAFDSLFPESILKSISGSLKNPVGVFAFS